MSDQPNNLDIRYLEQLEYNMMGEYKHNQKMFSLFSQALQNQTGLDKQTMDRSMEQFTQQLEFIDLYEHQFKKWLIDHPEKSEKIHQLLDIHRKHREYNAQLRQLLEKLRI